MTSVERLVHQPGDAEEFGSAEPAPSRHFGDDEVRRILQRAAELQEGSHEQSLPSGRGLTLGELRNIAVEAGIDPKFIDMAANQEVSALATQGNALAGGPSSWQLSATVPGEIQDVGRERILQAIRTIMGHKGELEYVFGRMEWSVDNGVGPVIVGVSSRDGETEVTVSASKQSEVALYHGLGVPFSGIFGGAITASVLGLSGVVVLPIIGTIAVGAYGLARVGWRARSNWWARHLQDLLDRIVMIVQEEAVVPGAESLLGESTASALPPPEDGSS